MTSQGLQPEDALLSAAGKPLMVVQVDELAVPSPTAEPQDVLSTVIEVSREIIRKDHGPFEPLETPTAHSRTQGMERCRHTALSATSAQRSSSHEVSWRKLHDPNASLRDRGLRMQLPSFQSLGISSSDSGYFGPRSNSSQAETGAVLPARSPSLMGRAAAQSLPLPNSGRSQSHDPNWGSTPLLTPPEDIDSIKWNNAILHSSTHHYGGSSSAVPQTTTSQPATTLSNDDAPTTVWSSSNAATSQAPLSGVPDSAQGQPGGESHGEDMNSRGNNESPLARAIRALVSSVRGSTGYPHNIQIIAQILPEPVRDASRTKPAFEEVVETIQNGSATESVPFITITHAVPPKFEMKDLPTSPPATPNNAQSRGDYFGQSVFSNAATVSAYHTHNRLLNTTGPPSPNTIVAPSSVQLSVLERYIPPTSGLEYGEFFSSTGHSVLVDRLAELSVRDGRLLLIYPTKTGAETFQSSYLIPVMDPFLRRFIFLNNLFFHLGSTLGDMAVIPDMFEFEEMDARIKSLCQALSSRASLRGGPKSTFTVVHSSRGEAIVDSATWREWFVQQELPRIRANLVEYHKNGGRMPQPVGHREITTGVLAREVADGISESEERAGEVPIELGMFVIQRTSS